MTLWDFYSSRVGARCSYEYVELCRLLFIFRKRYDKAEEEFVAAKRDLFSRKENKEMLTEHLYSIIQENELKKARKLEEIMSKLNMDIVADDVLDQKSTESSTENTTSGTLISERTDSADSNNESVNNNEDDDQVAPSDNPCLAQ